MREEEREGGRCILCRLQEMKSTWKVHNPHARAHTHTHTHTHKGLRNLRQIKAVSLIIYTRNISVQLHVEVSPISAQC